MLRPCKVLRLLRCVSLLVQASMLVAGLAHAGAFVHAGETHGVDHVSHPKGYSGAGGVVNVSVCIDPTSPNAAAMEIPVQNAIDTWNTLGPQTGNLQPGAIGGQLVDFETLVVHELGHCIGLAHTNAATESLLPTESRNYTKATDGVDNVFDIDDGADNIIGSGDDLRDDDVNLHWFQRANNNPFTLAPIVDSTTYSRAAADLPGGDLFAANADRDVGATLFAVPNTEAVMNQGSFGGELQRELGHDDVASLRLAMSGVDEIAETADDYALSLRYAGVLAGCDLPIKFDDAETGFAVCKVSSFPSAITGTHGSLVNPRIFYNTGFNWFFTPPSPNCGNSAIDVGEQCDDGNTANGDCCSATCHFEPVGTACDDGEICSSVDECNGAGVCTGVASLQCDNGLFCDGNEFCSGGVGCQPGTPPLLDDGSDCTVDACDEVSFVTHTPDDSLCMNGIFCDGVEICIGTPGTGCLGEPPPPPPDDFVDCTDDLCDEPTQSFVHIPNAANCDDFNPCTADSCDAVAGCGYAVVPGCSVASVTFEGAPVDPNGALSDSMYQEGGYRLIASPTPENFVIIGPLFPGLLPNNGTNVAFIQNALFGSSDLVIDRDFQTFGLVGVDLGQGFGAAPGTVVVTGDLVGGGMIETTLNTSTNVFTSFTFGSGWEELVSVRFSPSSVDLTIDNVELSRINPAPVPALEPPGLWALAVSLVAIAVATRLVSRRREL